LSKEVNQVSVTRISAAVFVLLTAYIVLGAAFLPIPPRGVAAGGVEFLMLNALGLGWFFALWAALVAGMVFLITWTSTGVVAAERARERRRTMQATPAGRIEAAEERVLAQAS
jgi:hypothetical protein